MAVDIEELVTIQKISDIVGIDRSFCSKVINNAGLAKSGGVPLKLGIRAILDHYRGEAERESTSLEKERTLLTKAQREKAEIELEELRRQKIDIGEAKEVIQKILTVMARALDRMPNELASSVVGCATNQEAKIAIEKVTRQAREELYSDNTLQKLKE